MMISISLHPLLLVKTSFQHLTSQVCIGAYSYILDLTDFIVESQILLSEEFRGTQVGNSWIRVIKE